MNYSKQAITPCYIIIYRSIVQQAVAKGAKPVKEPWEERDDHGVVTFATVQTVSNGCGNWL